MKVYHEKEQAEKGKIQNVQLEEKGEPGNEMELSPVFKEMNRLKTLNRIKGVITWQDPTHLCF